MFPVWRVSQVSLDFPEDQSVTLMMSQWIYSIKGKSLFHFLCRKQRSWTCDLSAERFPYEWQTHKLLLLHIGAVSVGEQGAFVPVWWRSYGTCRTRESCVGPRWSCVCEKDIIKAGCTWTEGPSIIQQRDKLSVPAGARGRSGGASGWFH